jgi:hypothetical protein
MKSIIYKTINLHNKKLGINPYRYIGSDQHNKPNYYGSNKKLQDDIKKLGIDQFEKNILFEFENISNIDLRKIESDIQTKLDVAKDPSYYNKTNSSHKGYIESIDEKTSRINKTLLKRKIWWDNLTEEEKELHNKKSAENLISYNKSLKGKTYKEIYGDEKSLLYKDKLKGEKNGKSKKIQDIESGIIFGSMVLAMKYYGIKKHSTLVSKCLKSNICKIVE